ncbi:MAG: hypothetical protein ABIO70_22190 [Pseudomonadota bacterium]
MLSFLLVTLLGLRLTTADGGEDRAAQLLEQQVTAWQDPEQRAATRADLRRYNPEWDFMQRTFLVLSLADAALAEPARQPELLPVMDSLIDDTLAQIEAHGARWFLMDYVDRAPFRNTQGRSLFVDGEVALMLGARRLVRDDPARAAQHQAWDALIERHFAEAPALLPESYPDEAWLFCVTNALVALRMADALDGSDHGPLVARWVSQARADLLEPTTGLLGSEFTWDGAMLDGPEGSSIWLVATNLLLLDEPFARDQYARARDALYGSLAGLGYAREWGPGWEGPVDVDSGPIVPVLDASPSSSGFALMAATAFGDEPTRAALERSLHAADLLVRLDPRLAALADNAVGDAVLLHALTFGPLWAEIGERLEG